MNVLCFIIVILVFELALGTIFTIMTRVFHQGRGINFQSLTRGFIERLFLFIGLSMGFPHTLTLFGALKVATRLKHQPEDPINEDRFNTFYLVGNFLSVTAVFAYIYINKYYGLELLK